MDERRRPAVDGARVRCLGPGRRAPSPSRSSSGARPPGTASRRDPALRRARRGRSSPCGRAGRVTSSISTTSAADQRAARTERGGAAPSSNSCSDAVEDAARQRQRRASAEESSVEHHRGRVTAPARRRRHNPEPAADRANAATVRSSAGSPRASTCAGQRRSRAWWRTPRVTRRSAGRGRSSASRNSTTSRRIQPQPKRPTRHDDRLGRRTDAVPDRRCSTDAIRASPFSRSTAGGSTPRDRQRADQLADRGLGHLDLAERRQHLLDVVQEGGVGPDDEHPAGSRSWARCA